MTKIETENKILDIFLFNKRLRFNQIEKAMNIRSNKLVYHLKNLTQKNILSKEGEFYSLSDSAEYLIPYLSQKKSALPVILISIGNKKEVFLYPRKKRPYDSLLSLPGGRLIIGESISDAVSRIMKEKHNISSSLKQIHSVSLEHIKKSDKIIHSFILIFVSATTKDELELTNLIQNKKKIIPSDYKLLTTHRSKKIDLDKISSIIS
jgi:ADP-ribose pyrophosphatase YjhB (NUDIX family)